MTAEQDAILRGLRTAWSMLYTQGSRLGADTEAGRQLAAARDLIAGVADMVKADAASSVPTATQEALDAFPGSRLTGTMSPETARINLAAINRRNNA